VTTALVAPLATTPRTRAPRLARLAEFVLVGGLTPALFPVAWLLRRALGVDASELAVGFVFFHAAYLVNDPHFSVTYLLFYKDVKRRAIGDVWGRAQRARYVFAGFVVPVVLLLWAGVALATRSAPALGWLIQLMFLLVGWHYVKQGFGVMMVLSARRGVRLSSAERRAFVLHAFAAWAYAWASPADPGTEVEERGVVYRTLAHGASLERATFVVFFVSAVWVAVVLARRRRVAKQPLPPLGALFGYLSALWAWTVYSRLDPLVVYAIPALHSLQYLYFVWLLRRSESRAAGDRPFAEVGATPRLAIFALSAVALAWIVFHGVPETLDAALFVPRGRAVDLGRLGTAPSVAAVFVCVNVHHYFMDAVIWRHENPEMKFLVVRPGARR